MGIRTEDGQVWIGVRKACRDIGLTDAQARAEVLKIQESLLFKSNCLKFETVQKEGIRDVKREILVLAEKFVPMWLAQINLTPSMQKKNPKAVHKLLKYQLEAIDVLHKAFYETDKQKSTFNAKMGLEGKIEDLKEQLKMVVVQLNNVEDTLDKQDEKLNAVMDNMTLTTVQQGRLQRAVKDRVNHLLGGAHNSEYKEWSHTYFINLWNGIKERFQCGSRWQDLNPKYFNAAFDYVLEWEYAE